MFELCKIFVISVFFYVNGFIYLGYMLEYIQMDMWVCFQKMCGNQVVYVCVDDVYGLVIMFCVECEGIIFE